MRNLRLFYEESRGTGLLDPLHDPLAHYVENEKFDVVLLCDELSEWLSEDARGDLKMYGNKERTVGL